jgi:hypothetical protein
MVEILFSCCNLIDRFIALHMGAGYDLHTKEGWEGLRKASLVLYVLEYVHIEHDKVIYIHSIFKWRFSKGK